METQSAKRECKKRGCKAKVASRNLCSTHYGRLWRSPDFIAGPRGPKPKWKYPTEGSATLIGRRLGVSRQRAHQAMNRDKHQARQSLRFAVKSGKIVKPDECARCHAKSTDLEAHHSDYSKPLDVMWLCVPCHNIVHPHPNPLGFGKRARTREEIMQCPKFIRATAT